MFKLKNQLGEHLAAKVNNINNCNAKYKREHSPPKKNSEVE